MSYRKPEGPEVLRLVELARQGNHDAFVEVVAAVADDLQTAVEDLVAGWTLHEVSIFAENVLTHSWRLIRGCQANSPEDVLRWFTLIAKVKLKSSAGWSPSFGDSPLSSLQNLLSSEIYDPIDAEELKILVVRAVENLPDKHQRILHKALTSTRAEWSRRDGSKIRSAVAAFIAAMDTLVADGTDLASEGT